MAIFELIGGSIFAIIIQLAIIFGVVYLAVRLAIKRSDKKRIE